MKAYRIAVMSNILSNESFQEEKKNLAHRN